MRAARSSQHPPCFILPQIQSFNFFHREELNGWKRRDWMENRRETRSTATASTRQSLTAWLRPVTPSRVHRGRLVGGLPHATTAKPVPDHTLISWKKTKTTHHISMDVSKQSTQWCCRDTSPADKQTTLARSSKGETQLVTKLYNWVAPDRLDKRLTFRWPNHSNLLQ
jgi:hypothetical protein